MNKKVIALIIAIIIFIVIAGIIFAIYLQNDNENNNNNISQVQNNGNILIAYFSWSGNTENAAGIIREKTGADIIELNPVEPYSSNYNEVLDEAQRDMNNDARPEIATQIDNIDEYDTIFLGYPNWWGDMPMIIYSFLDEYNLSGKTIAPFCTSGGSGLSGTPRTIQNEEPNATVTEGLAVSGSSSRNSQSTVNNWLSQISFTQIQGDEETLENARIKLTVNGNEEVFVKLEDNQASRDFLEMLPLTLTFEDFNSTEKIATLPNELSTEGQPSGYTPEIGDFAYYAPWGNISVFYKDFRYSNYLYKLGTLESGADILGNKNEDFEVTIERVN